MRHAVKRQDMTSMDTSILMLKSVLDGATYEKVARDHGVTRTAVERRIKFVARHLNQTVGIQGMTEDGIGFVARLRASRHLILEALDSVDPIELSRPRRGKSVRVYSREEIIAAAGRIRAYSSQPARDVALFLLLFGTGLRPLEVARLRVRDYLQQDGNVRRLSVLPAEAAISGAARPLYFMSTRLDEALLLYLRERMAGATPAYLGLDPNQPLFLAADGLGFAIAAYRHGNQKRYLCRPILETYRRIFRYAGLPGATPLAVRVTVAARLYDRGAEDKQVGLLLGISQRSSVRQMFPRAKPSVAQLVEELI